MSEDWPYGEKSIEELKLFCDVIIRNQHLLWLPEFKFFKDFIESFGGKIPVPPKKMESPPKTPASESESESDLEIDTEGCLEPDEISPDQKMGDPDKEVTDEEREKSIEKRSEALEQFYSDNIEKSIELYTEAIELDPTSALLFAKRGQAYLKLTRPKACIKDCSRAVDLNSSSAQAFKYRGRASQLLGEWLNAWHDLRKAREIDLDEEIQDWLKEVSPKAEKIEEHMQKKAKKQGQKKEEGTEKLDEQREGYAKARTAGETGTEDAEAHVKAAKEFDTLFSDPDFKEAMCDPEVAAAVREIGQDPTKIGKYETNPKVMAFLGLMSKKFLQAGITTETLTNFYKWGAFASMPTEAGGAAAPSKDGAGAAPPQKFQPDDDNLD